MATTAPSKPPPSTEYLLKKYLLLLATLVATVTYAAGLNLPGGSWLEDAPAEGHVAGDSILRETSYRRYIVFYYFNAISFAASLLVGLLLLILHQDGGEFGSGLVLQMVWVVMVVDLLGLMGAYGVGCSHDRFTIFCGAALLVSGVVAFGVIALLAYINEKRASKQQGPEERCSEDGKLENMEILLVLAIFAATVAYVAGLNPPGGFWRDTDDEHIAGEPVMQGLHPRRYRAFFFFNTTAFVASLLAIMLIVCYDKLQEHFQHSIRVTVSKKLALYVPLIIALLGLGGAYAFGSCRDGKHTIYVVAILVAVPVASLVLQIVAHRFGVRLTACGESIMKLLRKPRRRSRKPQLLEKTREDVQLLAILAATIAYQAGVDPPGGVWAETGEGHKVGDPILRTTHPLRYKVFFYFNSGALVASLVIMLMLQNERLVRRHALEAAIILDLFGLIGAFAAGSGRDTNTSIYTVALAGAVLIYVVIHITFFTLDRTPPHSTPPDSTPTSAPDNIIKIEEGEEEYQLQKSRDVLLLLSILGATLTYQAGLTPPGGFWEKDDKSGHHRAGFPVLLDQFPRRYKTFYYCNAASFMTSVALIVLLMNPNMYRPGIRCYALYVCMVAGVLGLMGAYSAGSSLHLRTSIIQLTLVAALTIASFAVAACVMRCFRDKRGPVESSHGQHNNQHGSSTVTNNVEVGSTGTKLKLETPAPAAGSSMQQEEEEDRKKKEQEAEEKREKEVMMYLMMVGILGASVTYLTGLKPPGGMWRDYVNGHSAGNPVLYDTKKLRYNVFFYSNSTSFMASITIIASLLWRMLLCKEERHVIHLWPMHAAMVLDVLTLLVAYAAGSARKRGTSTKVVLLFVPMLLIIWGVLSFCNKCQATKREKKNFSRYGKC